MLAIVALTTCSRSCAIEIPIVSPTTNKDRDVVIKDGVMTTVTAWNPRTMTSESRLRILNP